MAVIFAGNLNQAPQLSANLNSSNNFCRVTYNGLGNVTATVGCPGVVVTHTSVGTYTMTFPAAVDVLIMPFVVRSSVPTIFYCVITALAPALGTATFKTYTAAGTAMDPNAGDIIGFEFFNQLSAI